MPKKIKKKKGRNPLDVINFISLGHQDYLSSRLLLLNGFLPQGVSLAATAIEKLLKAVVLVKGDKCEGHLGKNILNAVKNKQPILYQDLNKDYIEFLKKAYELRYFDNIRDFGIVINQYRTLSELDKTVSIIDSGFDLKKGNLKQKTPYQNSVKSNEGILFLENYILNKTNLDEYYRRQNKVYEMVIDRDARVLSVNYETEGVNVSGSFLKPVSISTDKETQQLTLG